jgi:steroid 5-alpha reductase family enzyme
LLTWITTVGTYLFTRILSTGEDSRFKNIRNSPPKFAVAFFAQATWVSLVLLPILAVNSLPASAFSSLPATLVITDVLGPLLWASGFALEVTADRQKSAWSQAKKEKKHDEDFLTSGLYSKSRFPNYFGESTLWTGVATMASGVLASSAGQVGMGLAGWGVWGKLLGVGMAAASPAFTTFLLLKVSGVPMSEKKYDKRYGDREDYQKWKREVPRFFPKFW